MGTLAGILLAQIIGLAYTATAWREELEQTKDAALFPRFPAIKVGPAASVWFVAVLIATGLSFGFTAWASIGTDGAAGRLAAWQRNFVAVSMTLAAFALVAPPVLKEVGNALAMLIRPLVLLIVAGTVVGGALIAGAYLESKGASLASWIVISLVGAIFGTSIGWATVDDMRAGKVDRSPAMYFWTILEGVLFLGAVEVGWLQWQYHKRMECGLEADSCQRSRRNRAGLVRRTDQAGACR